MPLKPVSGSASNNFGVPLTIVLLTQPQNLAFLKVLQLFKGQGRLPSNLHLNLVFHVLYAVIFTTLSVSRINAVEANPQHRYSGTEKSMNPLVTSLSLFDLRLPDESRNEFLTVVSVSFLSITPAIRAESLSFIAE